jgi:hypothetical protein
MLGAVLPHFYQLQDAESCFPGMFPRIQVLGTLHTSIKSVFIIHDAAVTGGHRHLVSIMAIVVDHRNFSTINAQTRDPNIPSTSHNGLRPRKDITGVSLSHAYFREH